MPPLLCAGDASNAKLSGTVLTLLGGLSQFYHTHPEALNIVLPALSSTLQSRDSKLSRNGATTVYRLCQHKTLSSLLLTSQRPWVESLLQLYQAMGGVQRRIGEVTALEVPLVCERVRAVQGQASLSVCGQMLDSGRAVQFGQHGHFQQQSLFGVGHDHATIASNLKTFQACLHALDAGQVCDMCVYVWGCVQGTGMTCPQRSCC